MRVPLPVIAAAAAVTARVRPRASSGGDSDERGDAPAEHSEKEQPGHAFAINSIESLFRHLAKPRRPAEAVSPRQTGQPRLSTLRFAALLRTEPTDGEALIRSFGRVLTILAAGPGELDPATVFETVCSWRRPLTRRKAALAYWNFVVENEPRPSQEKTA
jgi:hypothetical protein